MIDDYNTDEDRPLRIEDILDPITKLNADLKNAARTLSDAEARFLVDAYYAMQGDRIRAANQVRALSESAEPSSIMQWLSDQRYELERQVARALDYYSAAHPAGEWARSITGIGPIIAAGLLAHANVKDSPTVGHIWRYAGLDPTSKWLGTAKGTEVVNVVLAKLPARKGRRAAEIPHEAIVEIAAAVNTSPERFIRRLTDYKTGKVTMTREALIRAAAKRPWNASLKRLCFLIGESFVKVHRLESDHYGKMYVQRKDYEITKNDMGDYAAQCAESLSTKKFGDDTDAKAWYTGCYPAGTMRQLLELEATKRASFLASKRVPEGKGVPMLPPARIHRRSCRYAVKLFIAHYHHVCFELEFKTAPPKPYIMDIGGHTHFLAPPNWR